MTIRDMKASAKTALKGRWGLAILMLFISGILTSIITSVISQIGGTTIWSYLQSGNYEDIPINQSNFLLWAANILLFPVLSTGLTWFFFDLYDRREVGVGTLFSGFKKYGPVVGANFMVSLFTMLWTLLLIVPGIIKALSYSQTLYLIKDRPELSVMDAIKESKRLMKGSKWRLFLTQLSFIGWILLPILGLIGAGIALVATDSYAPMFLLTLLSIIYFMGINLYLRPYYQTTMAAFYRDLTKNKME